MDSPDCDGETRVPLALWVPTWTVSQRIGYLMMTTPNFNFNNARGGWNNYDADAEEWVPPRGNAPQEGPSRTMNGTATIMLGDEFNEFMLNSFKSDFGNHALRTACVGRFGALGEEMAQTLKTMYILRLAEDVFDLLVKLLVAQTKLQYIDAVSKYCKMRSSAPAFIAVMSQMAWMMGQIRVQQSFEERVKEARFLFESWSDIKNSPFVQKAKRLALFCMVHDVFGKMGMNFLESNYTVLEREALKREHSNSFTFMEVVIDTTIFAMERGLQCYKLGKVQPLFHCGGRYIEWLDSANDLKRKFAQLGVCEAHGFTEFEFTKSLKEALEKGKSIISLPNSDSISKGVVSSLLRDLRTIQDDLVTKHWATQERKAPFSVLLYGSTSVGKSMFANMLYAYYGKIMGLPEGVKYKFTRNPADRFWVNFDSSQWCVQLDDIAFLAPNVASGGGDPTLMEMLQVINNVPFMPPQAALDDKGRTPLRAKFVIATTNTKELNAKDYFSCPSAVQRRLPFVIKISPKKEYSDASGFLNVESIPATIPGEYPNLWDIRVEKASRPANLTEGRMQRDGVTYTHVDTFNNVYEFLGWFRLVAKAHEESQANASEANDNLFSTALCSGCQLPVGGCSCPIVQSMSIVPMVVRPAMISTLMDQLSDKRKRIERIWQKEVSQAEISGAISDLPLWKRLYVWFWLLCVWAHDRVPLVGRIVAFVMGAGWFQSFLQRKVQTAGLRKVVFKIAGDRVKRSLEVVGLNSWKLGLLVVATCSVSFVAMHYAVKHLKSDDVKDDKTIEQSIPKNKERLKTQSDCSDSGEKEVIPLKRERINAWIKEDFALTSFDVPLGSKSMGKGKVDDFVKILAPNLVHFRSWIEQDGQMIHRNIRGLCIKGHMYVVSAHGLPEEGMFHLQMITADEGEGISPNTIAAVDSSDIERIPGRDIAILNFRHVPPRRDISKFIAGKSFDGVYKGYYLKRVGCQVETNLVENLQRSHVVEPNAMANIDCFMWSGISATLTANGDCGSLLVVDTSYGPVICGMHVFGYQGSNKVSATCLDIESLNELMGKFNSIEVQAGEIILSQPSAPRELVGLHHKASVRFVKEGSANVYGGISGFRNQHSSKVGPTLMRQAALKRGYVVEHGPPDMSWEPIALATEQMVKPYSLFIPAALKDAKDAYVKDILSQLSEEDLAMFHVVDDFTAVNGCAGVAFMDKLNRNSSAGFPWCTTKKKFLEPEEARGGTMHAMKLNQEMEMILREMEAIAKRGERVNPIFSTHLKDEPTTFSKIKRKKTRVHNGSTLPHSVLSRKVLMGFIRLVQNNPFIFECAPGTNTHSLEWEAIMEWLTVWGLDRSIGGDHEFFDKKMPAILVLLAFDVILAIARAAKIPEDWLRVIASVGNDTAFPLMDFFGVLIMLFGTNPSGNVITVIINSIVHSIYMRYVYAVLNEDGPWNFRENVRLMTYGDDMVACVKPGCECFDHTKIRDVLAMAGLKFTMPDKETESVPFVNFFSLDFLKRKWRWDEDLGAHTAQLCHSSINKMLTTCVVSFPMEKQAVDAMSSALREYFFYGKETYQEKRKMIDEMIDDLGLRNWLNGRPLPTWHEEAMRFWRASKFVPGFERKCPARFRDLMKAEQEKQIEVSDSLQTNVVVVKEPEGDASLATPFVSITFKHLQEELSCGSEQSSGLALESNPPAGGILAKNVAILQSESIPVEIPVETSSGDTEDHENVGFMDNGVSTVYDGLGKFSYGIDDHDKTVGVELGGFLSRPVKITEIDLALTDTTSTEVTFLPWLLYFNNSVIKKKLDNYAYIRCTLKLKFVFNASPFLYGAYLASYRPLSGHWPDNTQLVASAPMKKVPLSQRPHVWIMPQAASTTEMVLPFFYHKNWLETTLQEVTDFGEVTFTCYSPLRSANAASGSGTTVTVQVFAWAEDVMLSAPTSALALQSKSLGKKSEYSVGPVSGAASAIATAAGALKSVPVIGKYATATSFVAGAIGDVASLLGFTNVPVIDNTMPSRLSTLPNLCSPIISAPVDRLCLDPKNELTIDPAVAGLGDQDELSIQYLVQRDSYVDFATWTSGNNPGTKLLNVVGSPFVYRELTVANVYWCFPPVTAVSMMFNHWRGDLVINLKAICSKYHKGRLKLVFDPTNNVSTIDPDFPSAFTQVWDIAESQEIDIVLPYMKAVEWLDCAGLGIHQGYTLGTILPLNLLTDSGMLTVSVLTRLTSPTSTASVDILFSIKAGKNFEVAYPKDYLNNVSQFVVQSQDVIGYGEPKDIVMGNSNNALDDARYLRHFGENIVSLRQLLRRSTLAHTVPILGNVASTVQQLTHVASVYPMAYGADPNGVALTASSIPFNYSRNIPYNIIAPWFVGQRGSVRWHYNTDTYDNSNAPFTSFRVYRDVKLHSDTSWMAITNSSVYSGTISASNNMWNGYRKLPGGAGMAATNGRIQPCHSVEFPFFSEYKFHFTSPRHIVDGVVTDGTDQYAQVVQLEYVPKTTSTQYYNIEKFFCIGGDFNLLFFLNIPMYGLQNLPNPI